MHDVLTDVSAEAHTCRPLRIRICKPLLGRNPGSRSASAGRLIRTKSFVAPACCFPLLPQKQSTTKKIPGAHIASAVATRTLSELVSL